METYEPTGLKEEPLNIPITVIGGLVLFACLLSWDLWYPPTGEKETAIPASSLVGWRACTSSVFRQVVIPNAGHFYYEDPKFLQVLQRAVEDAKADKSGM